MATQIFVNLPVKDLDRSVAFFTKLGFTFNPQFTDENATAMIISEDIIVMLLVENFFKSFTGKEINDTAKTSEVILSLSAESRAQVDDILENAIAAGAATPNAPQDHGWMYQRGFEDLDGHAWEFAYMDMSSLPQE